MNKFESLKLALDIKVDPIGVKLLYDHNKNHKINPEFKEVDKLEGYCEYVKRASQGEFLKIQKGNFSCHTGNIMLGTIEYRGGGNNYKTKYIPEDDNNDIFGYSNDDIASKLIDNRFRSINEWIEGTYHLDYPMYPDLIPRHFKNPRSSDIIVSTGGKVIFNHEHEKKENEYLYAHDIGLRKCAIVPLIIGGSKEIPYKEIPYCKTTDIVPTLLKIIGSKDENDSITV